MDFLLYVLREKRRRFREEAPRTGCPEKEFSAIPGNRQSDFTSPDKVRNVLRFHRQNYPKLILVLKNLFHAARRSLSVFPGRVHGTFHVPAVYE